MGGKAISTDAIIMGLPSWRLLALDIGDARIGLAISDPSGTVVTPLRVILRRPQANALAAIAIAAIEEEAIGIVAGLPLRLSGDYSAQTRSVVAFVEKLRELVQIPIITSDERYSTVEAERILRERGVRRDRWREQIDAVAATVILQDFLDAHIRPTPTPAPYEDDD